LFSFFSYTQNGYITCIYSILYFFYLNRKIYRIFSFSYLLFISLFSYGIKALILELCLLRLSWLKLSIPHKILVHLNSSDNPSFLIVPIILEGLNYHHWSPYRLYFILVHCFSIANILVVSWILKVVSPSIAQSIIYIHNVFNIWNDLKERFS